MTDDTAFNLDVTQSFRKALSWIAPAVFIAVAVTALYLNWDMRRYRAGEVVIDGRVTVAVKVADTPEKRQKGLTVRESLPEGEGMLFEFPHPDRYRFWMKDMKYPIDIIWIFDEEIVDFSLDVQPAVGSEQVIPGYEPAVPANRVLEVPSGFVARHGLRLGTSVSYRIDTK